MKQRLLFVLIVLAALALCLLPALCFGQTVGQRGIPRWTGSGTVTEWVTPENGKVFRLNASTGVLEMGEASGSTTLAGLTDVAFTSLATNDFMVRGASGWVNLTPANARTAMGLGTIATQASSSVSISGGVISGLSTFAMGGNTGYTWNGIGGQTLVVKGYPVTGSLVLNLPTTVASESMIVTTGDSGTVTSTMLAGSIALSKIAQGGATSGQAMAWNGSVWAPATIAATPGGSSGQVQYNNGGAFGGVSGLTLTTGTLSAASISGGTVTSSAPLLSMSQTWNAAAVFHAADISITNTASSAGSTLQRWQVGGSPVMSVALNTAGGNDASPWRLVFDTSGSLGFNQPFSAFTFRNAANSAWASVYSGGFYSNGGGVTSPTYLSAGAVNGVEGETQLDTSNNRGPGLRMRNTGTIMWTTGTSVTSAADIIIDIGTASPEAAVTANPGSMYLRNNGGAGELWIKTSGTGNTGWSQVTIP